MSLYFFSILRKQKQKKKKKVVHTQATRWMGSVPCLTNWCRASIGSTLAFGLACIFTWCCLVLPTSTRRKQVFNLDIDVWLRLSRRSQHLKTLPALKFVKEKERRLLHNTMCSARMQVLIVVLSTYSYAIPI